MTLTGHHLVAGRRSREGNAGFRAHDPRTAKALDPEYADASDDEISMAVREAKGAMRLHGFADPSVRARLLREIANRIEALGEDLIERAASETALTGDRLRSERARTTGQLRLFADVVEEGSWVEARIDGATGRNMPNDQDDIRRMLVPLGPVVVFGASNFPLAFSVAGGDTASALAAGCPVVIKAHPLHPGTSELVGQAVRDAVAACGLPGGVASVLQGKGHDVGAALVNHPGIHAVAFTGSLAGGRALFDIAAKRAAPIPVFAEMGSVNPMVLLPNALSRRPHELADAFFDSMTLGVGQFCTQPGLVVVVEGEGLDVFLDRCRERTLAFDAPPMLATTMYQGYERGRAEWGVTPGVETIAETPAAHDASSPGCASLYATDVRAFVEAEHLSDEVFGPASLIVRARNATEMEQAVTHFPGALVGTVHAEEDDLQVFSEIVETLQSKVGRFVVNGVPTGVKVGHAMQHGGPYPATTDPRFTSVGTAAIYRFARPLCYQGVPNQDLPPGLQDGNPLGIWRLIDGAWTRDAVTA